MQRFEVLLNRFEGLLNRFDGVEGGMPAELADEAKGVAQAMGQAKPKGGAGVP